MRAKVVDLHYQNGLLMLQDIYLGDPRTRLQLAELVDDSAAVVLLAFKAGRRLHSTSVIPISYSMTYYLKTLWKKAVI